MALPAQFLSAVQSNGKVDLLRWVEIEGIPYAYGNVTKSASWFTPRASAGDRFLGIKSYLQQIPANFDAQLDPLEGTPQTGGQVEFHIGDADGSPTLWTANANKAKWLYVGVFVAAGDVTIQYTGIADTALFPTGGGTLYIGLEAITYTAHNTGTKQFTGCTRAKYRTRAKTYGVGFPITPQPITMRGRRVWYYQAAQRRDTLPQATVADADKVLRFLGRLENLRLADHNIGVYILSVLSMEKELDRGIFRALGTLRDLTQKGIAGPPHTDPGVRTAGEPGGSEIGSKLYTSDAAQFNNGRNRLFMIDDEVVGFSFGDSSGPFARLNERGCFNTPLQVHKPGFVAKEVAWVCYVDNMSGTVPFEHAACEFNSVETLTSPLPPDHPLMVLLQIVLSTGLGTNFTAGKRNYDVLPEDWGLGIDVTRVDVAGIEKVASECPNLRVAGVIKEEVPFMRLAKSLLAPYGFFLTTDIGDSLTVRRLRPPMPDEAVKTITRNDVINKNHPGWDGNLSGAVQEVIFNHSKNIKTNDWQNLNRNIFLDAKLFTDDQGRRITYDMPLLYEKGSIVSGAPRVGGQPNVDLLLLERADYFKQGYARPPPIVSARLHYKHIDLKVGDVVSVTMSLLPNVGTGARGLTTALMRVMKKTIDDQTKTVIVALWDTGYNINDYRYIAPSLQITTVPSTGVGPIVITVAANAFTLAVDGQKDMLLLKPDGTLQDWCTELMNAAFNIAHVPKDFSATNSLGILAVNTGANQVTLNFVPGTMVAGDFLVFNTYLGATASHKATYAAAVDSDLLLGGSADAAHRYFP